MLVRQIADSKLAQFAYLIGCPRTGEAIVIDPERDVDRYFDLAARHKLRIVAAADTHRPCHVVVREGLGVGAMSKELGFNVELTLSFDAAVTRVREALKQEGFGVLTEIDLRAAFREKLGREFRPYVILGACNPPLAFSAISADPSVGLLLPCNVTVEWLAEGRTGVRLTDPEALLSAVVLQGAPELTSVARDARERMVRVAESLAKR
jgi:uncharacterized protein (DUF302 family)